MLKKNVLIKLRNNFGDSTKINTKDFLKVSPYIDRFAFNDKKTVAEILDVSWWRNYWKQWQLLNDVVFDKISFKVKEKINVGVLCENLDTAFLFCRLLTGKTMPKKGLSSGRLVTAKKIKLLNNLDSDNFFKPGKVVSDLINYYLNLCEKNISATEIAALITQFGLQELLFKTVDSLDKLNLVRLKILILMLVSEKILTLEALWNKLPNEHRMHLINPIKEFADKHDLTIIICSDLDFEINALCKQIIYLKNKDILISLPINRYYNFFKSVEQVFKIIK